LTSENKKLEFVFNTTEPGSSGYIEGSEHVVKNTVIGKKLDSVAGNKISKYDVLVMKIDTEGMEIDVLKGARKFINSKKEIYILLEDFVNPRILEYLQNLNAKFICKLTPYNSWWKI